MNPYLPEGSALGHLRSHAHTIHQRQVRTLDTSGATLAIDVVVVAAATWLCRCGISPNTRHLLVIMATNLIREG